MESRSNRSVLMLPWLAHGHISPFVELAKRLSARNFVAYICSSKVNLDTSVKPSLSPKDSDTIKFVELPIPCTEELPPHLHTTNGLPPHLMNSLKFAFDDSRHAFSDILKTLRPDIVVYDFLQPWAPEEAASLGIPSVLFLPTGAATFSLLMCRGFDPNMKYPFGDSIYFRDYEQGIFNRLTGKESSDTKDNERVMGCVKGSSDIVLLKTFDELEGNYVDFLTSMVRKKFVPVGPLVRGVDPGETELGNDVIEWLDGQGSHRSTVFVSFGSEYFLSENEIQAIADGLERSGLRFVWVVRFHKSQKVRVEDKLPPGFAERTAERGKIVEGWAPQKRILSHHSVGGFMSHCGWSSVMESLYFGVPIVAVPMNLDQPLNARLVAAVGCGEEVVRSREGMLAGDEVAKVLKRVVLDESGEGVRKRVKEMSEVMREGKGEKEIDGVVREFESLCGKRMIVAGKDESSKNEFNMNDNMKNNLGGDYRKGLMSGSDA